MTGTLVLSALMLSLATAPLTAQEVGSAGGW